MFYKFTQDSLIIIPFTYKGYRLADGEKVRFRCLFKRADGDYQYTLELEEDNKGNAGVDGHYTVTLDTKVKGILPGRYNFSLELVLASGSTVTLKTKDETGITITSAPYDKESDFVE